MILEFTVTCGFKYRLDRELMTWGRYVADNSCLQHGKLHSWPNPISIGKSVQIFNLVDGIGYAIKTGEVVSIKSVERDEPESRSGAAAV